MTRVRLKSAHGGALLCSLESDGRESVLATFQRADQPLAASCEGTLLCGACWVEVLEGADGLPAPSERELRTLAQAKAPEGARLACRIFPRGDLLLRVPYR